MKHSPLSILFRRMAIIAMLVLLSVVFLPLHTATAQTALTAVVDTGALNVRTGPGPGYPVVGQVYDGDVLTLLGRDSISSWVHVQGPAGITGWVSTYYLIPSGPLITLPVEAEAEAWAIVAGPVNLRSGPGRTFNVILILNQNEPIGLIARNRDASWVQARVRNNTIGWVATDMIIPGSSLYALPLAAGLPAATVAGAAGVPATGVAGDMNAEEWTFTGAGYQNGHVAKLAIWEPVTILGRNADTSWLYILFRNTSLGWVPAHRVNTWSGPVASLNLPVIDDTKAPVGENVYGSGATISGAAAPAFVPGALPATTATATVITGMASIRSGPNSSYPLLGTAPERTVLMLLGRNRDGSWVVVRTPAGLEGWMSSALIETATYISTLPEVSYTPIDTYGSGFVSTGGPNVRSGPGMTFSVLGVVYQGDRLHLMGRDAAGAWLKVRTPTGLVGWVGSASVVIDVYLSDLPVVQ